MAKKVLAITGPTAGNLERGVVNTFRSENERFIREVFGVGGLRELTGAIRARDTDDSLRLFRAEQGSEQQCASTFNSGVDHILEYEIREAGMEASFAPFGGVVHYNEGGKLVFNNSWHKQLEQADLFAVSTSFILFHRPLDVLLSILEHYHKPIILGGIFVNKVPRSSLERLKADYILTAEAEGSLSRLLLAICTGHGNDSALLDTIPGLYWRHNGGLRYSTATVSLVDFETLRVYPTRELVQKHGNMQVYESVRGCPFRCEFCEYPYLMGNKKVRFKDADTIFKDWQELHRKGVRQIRVLDSLFTFPRRRLDRLLKLLIESKLSKEIAWHCFARATELSHPGVAAMLREAGCQQVRCGIESGAQTILNNIKKNTTVDENYAAIERCQAAGLIMLGFFIVGFPGETEETFKETLQLLKHKAPPLTVVLPWWPDHQKFSRVPIMQPDRVDAYQISVKQEQTSCNMKWWSKNIELSFGINWEHATMNLSEAMEHIAEIQKAIYDGEISTLDTKNCPACSLIYPNSVEIRTLGPEGAMAFWRGLSDHYIRFLHGERGSALRQTVDGWLAASGLSIDSIQ